MLVFLKTITFEIETKHFPTYNGIRKNPSVIICLYYCTVGWVDIGTRTKVPLKFVTYLSKITKINEKSVLAQ
jgi:hypothetical protein